MSSHAALAVGVEIRALRKSIGILCTAPAAFSFFIELFYVLSALRATFLGSSADSSFTRIG